MNLSQCVLLPFAWGYMSVMQTRNWCYSYGVKKSTRFSAVAVIGVGNLTIGGTGKTPMVEYLIKMLAKQMTIATLSRGYKRITKGFRLANFHDTAATLGDEPYQLYKKFSQTHGMQVAVAEKRCQGIVNIIAQLPKTQVVLLDDAFQHRAVQPHLNILLTDFHRPFFHDQVLPAGRLREPKKAARRASAVIVTKCPMDLPTATQKKMCQHIKPYCASPETPIFFTGIRYGRPKKIVPSKNARFSKHVLLITGIAHSAPLVTYVKHHYHLHGHMAFGDHHHFTKKDGQKILKAFSKIVMPKKCLLTTEKDSVRLMNENLKPILQDIPIFYLPIQVAFLKDKQAFAQLIFKTIEKNI